MRVIIVVNNDIRDALRVWENEIILTNIYKSFINRNNYYACRRFFFIVIIFVVSVVVVIIIIFIFIFYRLLTIFINKRLLFNIKEYIN